MRPRRSAEFGRIRPAGRTRQRFGVGVEKEWRQAVHDELRPAHLLLLAGRRREDIGRRRRRVGVRRAEHRIVARRVAVFARVVGLRRQRQRLPDQQAERQCRDTHACRRPAARTVDGHERLLAGRGRLERVSARDGFHRVHLTGAATAFLGALSPDCSLRPKVGDRPARSREGNRQNRGRRRPWAPSGPGRRRRLRAPPAASCRTPGGTRG